MKRIAIIDPSITGKGGHYLEYALRIAKEANEAGLRPILGAHEKFKNDGSFPGPAYSVFHKTFWEQSEDGAGYSLRIRTIYANVKKAIRSAFRPLYRSSLIWFHYSSLNLASARAQDLDSLFDPKLSIYSSSWMGVKTSALFVRFLYVLKLLKRRLATKPRGRFSAFKLRLKRFVRAILLLLLIVLGLVLSPAIVFIFLLRTLAAKILMPAGGVAQMSRDIERFLQLSKLEAGDVVFVPTVGIAEILAVAQVLKKKPHARKLKWRLLMRRDAFSGHQPSWTNQGGQLHVLRLKGVFHYAMRVMKGADVAWYTDTVQLATQHIRVSNLPFKVLAIPTGQGDSPAVVKNTIFHGYVGDARTEKGFQFISEIWDRFRLWSGFGRQDKLLVQSNFNVKGGEPEAVKGMLALRGQAVGEVDFVPGPLDSDQYNRVLSSCGVILLPYDAAAYASRSSGIFAEAVRKKIPVVVTSASWAAKVTEPIRQEWLNHIDSAFSVVSRLNSPDISEIRGQYWGLVKSDPAFDTAIFSFDFLTIIPGSGLIVELHLRDKNGDTIGHLSDVVMIIAQSVKIAFSFPAATAEFDVWIKPLNKELNILPRRVSLSLGRLQRDIVCGFGIRTTASNPESFAAALLDIRHNLGEYERQAEVLSRILMPAFDDAGIIDCLIRGEGVDFDRLYLEAQQIVSAYFAQRLPMRPVQTVVRARWSGR